jgi:hypothetical protein
LKWRTTAQAGSSVDLPLNQRLIDGLTRRFWLASHQGVARMGRQ